MHNYIITAEQINKLSTKDQIVKEAVKRGFKDAVYSNNSVIIFINKYSKRLKFDFKLGYWVLNDLIIKGTTPYNGAFVIFKNGIWAEVIKEVTLNYHQIAEKFGIDVEQLRINRL